MTPRQPSDAGVTNAVTSPQPGVRSLHVSISRSKAARAPVGYLIRSVSSASLGRASSRASSSVAGLCPTTNTPGISAGVADGKPAVSSVGELGRVLFTDYMFAFEVTSILIIAAMVGAVVIARKREE
mgnify:CR=1 FL=1